VHPRSGMGVRDAHEAVGCLMEPSVRCEDAYGLANRWRDDASIGRPGGWAAGIGGDDFDKSGATG